MLELRLALALAAMLVVPGWAVLALAPNWRGDAPLVRWCLAISISIAFYPVLFYATRALVSWFQWGPNKIALLLVAGAALIVYRLRRNWREQFGFELLEWIALAIFGMTLFTRFWIIRDHPYPAWTDSLHHTLLTLLTATEGKLPYDMQPYFPVPLGQYHLGLYALSGTLEMLSGAPAHTALLWMAQALNGLCGVSVYFVLDRKVGRVGAIVGAATVGLFSFQPAWYVNWGRFTQVASQTIVLTAWLVTWDAVRSWKQNWVEHRAEIWWGSGVAALLTAAVFLLHFRVAGFYIPLLAIVVVWELFRAYQEKTTRRVLLGAAIVGIASLVLVSPALWEALRIYLSATLKAPVMSDDVMAQTNSYFAFPWDSVFALGAEWWMVVLVGLGVIIGLMKRNGLVLVNLVWVGLLILVGEAYLLRITPLAFTNMGAILIALYLPAGLVVGAGAAEALKLFRVESRGRVENGVIALVLAFSFVASFVRANGIEEYRYSVTPADVAAMDWINANTPADARFAINTAFWLPVIPYGTDAGYWIPYYAGRRTTAATMLSSLGSIQDTDTIVTMSQAAKRLGTESAALNDLRGLGVQYIYIGVKGNVMGPGLDPARLRANTTMVYQRDGVTILKIE